jgi:3',5'-cyclic AMP phosphodiesterase CpdA
VKIPRPRNVACDTTAIIGDLHVPFHDEQALGSALSYIRELKPDRLVLNGDIPDFYAISRFSRDPSRRDKLQDEIDETNDILDTIDSVLKPGCEKHWVVGNHEDRLRRFLWDNPEIASLRDLSLERQCLDRNLESTPVEKSQYA